MKSYDIVIVGAGMAGATLALALSQHASNDLRIAVIEAKKSDEPDHSGFDARAIALSIGTVELLQQLNIWDSISEFATKISDIHISDQNHLGMSKLQASRERPLSDPLAQHALGYVVALEDMGHIFHQKLESMAHVDFYCPHKLTEIKQQESFTSILLDDGQTLRTQLVIAADGTHSKTCQLLGIELQTQDFEQSAVIANVATQMPVDGWAYERFTANGPVAFLPMSKAKLARTNSNDEQVSYHRYSVVWCLPPEEAKQQVENQDDEFLDALQQSFGWRLGKLTHTGQRFSYPLRLSYRSRVISHRLAIVGNAAQTLHPIAGQGFNLGMRDVMSLAETLLETKTQDYGAYFVLARYQNRRQADRDETISLTSNLVTLFSNQLPALQVGRNLGLLSLDYFQTLKRPIVQRTMGLVER